MGALDWTGLANDALGLLPGAGVGFLQSAFNHSRNSQNMEKQFRYQKELMRIQNDYNVQNWHMQNSYNTPIAQMQRLKAAGLNPDLMYGNGSAGIQAPLPNGVSGGSAPGYSPAPEGLNLASDIQAMVNAKLAGAQTVGKNIENKLLDAQFDELVKKVALDNKFTEEQTQVAIEKANNLRQEFSKLVAEINSMSTDREIRQKELEHWDEEFNKRMREYDDKHNISHEEYRRLMNTYDDFKRLVKANADQAEYDALIQKITKENMEKYSNMEHSFGLIGTFIGWIMQMIKAVK